MSGRVAVVNRGEAAVRLIRAVRELEEAHGYGMTTIALHTEAEQGALFVRHADEAVCIGSYLDYAELERALLASRADAVWVGWGFVAEEPSFVELCDRLGVLFIGPSAAAMRKLGDKIEAKLLAESVGVPVAPWSGGPVDDLETAREHALRIGFPLVVKARSGGGGRGIRTVNSEAELAAAFDGARADGKRYFGDPVVFLEQKVPGGRHVEVQVVADSKGGIWAPGVRDCSVQRRNQKLIEESGSPVLSAEQAADLRTAAKALVGAADYCGVATVEFLYSPETKQFVLLEVNTRLQVEHPVTEATTGLDLVKLQLHVAGGGTLEGDPPPEFGYAIEARLNAEDPDAGFAAAPGVIEVLDIATGPGVRVDTGYAAGEQIPPDFDSMIAKVIAWGRNRDEAMARLRRALLESTVVIRGGATNKAFLHALLSSPEVRSGSADTGSLDRNAITLPPAAHADVALLAAALEVYDEKQLGERTAFLAGARGGRPHAPDAVGRKVELRYQGRPYHFDVYQMGPQRYRANSGDDTVELEIERLSTHAWRLTVGERAHRVVLSAGPADYLVEVDGVPHRIALDEVGIVRAPAPAVVVALAVAPGDRVEAGATVAVLEAMKMETVVTAPHAGRIREVLGSVGSQISAGMPLVRIEPESTQESSLQGTAVSFDTRPDQSSRDERTKALSLLAGLRAFILGYDMTEAEGRRLVEEYVAVRAGLQEDAGLFQAELEFLRAFADMCELSRNRPSAGEESADAHAHSPREYLHSYLRTLDVERERLPESFRSKLSRALRHHDVIDLTPNERLHEAIHRVFLAQQRTSAQVPVVAALLERRLASEESLEPAEHQALGDVLERLVVATQLRYPALGDLARSIRFQMFDRLFLRRTRAKVYADVRKLLRYLAEHPDAPDRGQRMSETTASPELLVRLLGRQIGRRGSDLPDLLELLTRRYYRARELQDVGSTVVNDHRVISARYERRGEHLRLVTTAAEFSELRSAAETAAEVARRIGVVDESDRRDLIIEIYLSSDERALEHDTSDPASMAETLHQVLSGVSLPSRVRRVTTTVCGRGSSGMHLHFTYRADDDGRLHEDRLIRGLHPLTARRLELHRLSKFELTRLPSDEDVYLFHCVAPENPSDERLVAMAQIDDLTPLRDSAGRVLALPAAEYALGGCLETIRRQRAARPELVSLDMNRIFIYAWAPNELSVDDVETIAGRLVPTTAGAGLEEVMFLGRQHDESTGELYDVALRVSYQPGTGVRLTLTEPPDQPLAPLDEYAQKVRRSRARAAVYPYEMVPLLTGRNGSFVEHDLDSEGRLVPVDRAPGGNTAGVVVGVVSTPSTLYPEGISRVLLMGDPTKSLGAIAEPECARILAAIDLATRMGVPVEWLTLSSGARIAMDSGTENMDWVARVLRRLVEFTQAGNEVNVIVAGINVGAQPYWNAEATMLMHTRGILVMMPDSAMVLTGKESLDYSGGVSAEDNFGIGGYDRIMGPNGQAQYWAPNLAAACEVLFAHYANTYVLPGESAPRRATTSDPIERDVCQSPHTHPDCEFTRVGEIFSSELNAERKKPFDIRAVMRAVVDQDHQCLERWPSMAAADTAVVFDARLGGHAVTVLGIESRPIPRRGFLPADGPDHWTAGTLFPMSSKKAARAINATSGNRPLVVLANLSGFDGSPESMRSLQLEYGAEIGRAIVNFDGPIVFCVISRYHGGAFVVFSAALNDNMEVVAVEGSYASVIGGAPAAAVVFARDVARRTANDPRVRELEDKLATTEDGTAAHLRLRLAETRAAVRSEKLAEVADAFDGIHDIRRALEVGSVHAIIRASELRPYLVGAIERGLTRWADQADQ